ncbi:MAG: hypothetical protein D6722_04995 [Bacteroidetes bacterium]|nr:MAG: hypothetical protein D6722_04995 [Bacteroidota bacterium]
MKKPPFSDEDIIRFLFDEMKRPENETFLDALCQDEVLWQRYEFFQEIVEQLGAVQEDPSDQTVEQVLAYARQHAGSKALPRWFPLALNLNAVVAVAMVLFFSVAILGFAYKLQRADISPPPENLVQQVEPDHSLYEWDDPFIRQKLEDVRNGIETITDAPVL